MAESESRRQLNFLHNEIETGLAFVRNAARLVSPEWRGRALAFAQAAYDAAAGLLRKAPLSPSERHELERQLGTLRAEISRVR
jgi:hypothetical protein